MRKFKVALKHSTEFFSVEAEDFNIESSTATDQGIWFNFWSQPEEEDAVSIAAVPFENVLYIVAEQAT